MIVLGVDPGVNGAYAVYSQDGLFDAGELPTIGEGMQRMVSAPLLRDIIRDLGPIDLAYVERVGARPTDNGKSNAFRFGRAVGIIEGVCASLNISIQWVTPQVWKKSFGLPGEKEPSRQRALDLWPAHSALFKRKADHGRAEAALIALWGYRAAQAAGAAA